MPNKTITSVGLVWVLLVVASVGWGSYRIGYKRGMEAWERDMTVQFEDLMQKLNPGFSFEWVDIGGTAKREEGDG